RELEAHYRRLLRGFPKVTLPPPSSGALSHFTIRVPASEREFARERLWKQGIDTGTLFGFPSYCDSSLFPNASRASQELINLPMDPGLTMKHLNSIARTLGLN